MNKDITITNEHFFRLSKIVISLLTLFFVVIAKNTIAWEHPIPVGPDHLEKDLALSGMVVSGSPSDETVEYIMAMSTIQAELTEIVDYARVELWAPVITLKPGFHAKPDLGDGYFRAGVPTFKVNCVNMVDPSTDPVVALNSNSLDNFFNDNLNTPNDPDPTDHATFQAFCENEINILNHHFINEDTLPEEVGRYREQLVRFKLNRAWEWSPPELADLNFHNCINYLTHCITTGTDEWSDTFNASSYHTEGSISMVYFKHPDEDKIDDNDNLITIEGNRITRSYGKLNYDFGLAPWVMINYRRSDTNLDALDDGDKNYNGAGNGIRDDDEDRRAAHEHEFGHIFSVHHTWDERVEANRYDPAFPEKNARSNIMNYGGSSEDDDGNNDAYDATHELCSTGESGWGDRAMGFWYEPWNGEPLDVCQYWNRSWLEYYDNDGEIGGDLEVRELWSQVEIILYSAKHYKETWAD